MSSPDNWDWERPTVNEFTLQAVGQTVALELFSEDPEAGNDAKNKAFQYACMCHVAIYYTVIETSIT